MEEDINNLKEIVDLYEKEIKNNNYNTTATLDITDLKSIDNLLNELARLQKENEELKNSLSWRISYCQELEKDLFENCSNYVIPKQIVKDKIETLEKIQKELPNDERLERKKIDYKELLEKE